MKYFTGKQLNMPLLTQETFFHPNALASYPVRVFANSHITLPDANTPCITSIPLFSSKEVAKYLLGFPHIFLTYLFTFSRQI